eukprot:CAMPEP_0182589538 /NCGR_PEP_ID=MMETSP1324-20130603/69752_1 /TAXON_ID=236786 /ORGANISM="Florenciella sp., Strain RCC1587" /LENGTH=136 /DNA_ID=CAMNT_0024806683 /DNA_START=180 /DNA_END=588 /DNA_ORIENTATION=+
MTNGHTVLHRFSSSSYGSSSSPTTHPAFESFALASAARPALASAVVVALALPANGFSAAVDSADASSFAAGAVVVVIAGGPTAGRAGGIQVRAEAFSVDLFGDTSPPCPSGPSCTALPPAPLLLTAPLLLLLLLLL